MWLAGLLLLLSHKTFGSSKPGVHSVPFWQILDVFERTHGAQHDWIPAS